MDEMRIGSAFTKALISRIIRNAVMKSTGCDARVTLNDFNARIRDGKAAVHFEADLDISTDDILKLVIKAGM